MAKKKTRPATIATRIARVKRKLESSERKLRKNPGGARSMKSYRRLQRQLSKLLSTSARKQAKANPQRRMKGKPVFTLGALPAGRYLLTKRKGGVTAIHKFVPKKRRKR